MKKVVAIVSGGLDSVVLAHMLKSSNYDVHVMSVDYGQRHRKELGFAKECADRIGAPYETADLSPLRRLMLGSSQTDPSVPVPHGHYAADSMKVTVVPNRNMLMLAAATAWAITLKADAVAYGAHSGDHAIYPDCRPEFVDAVGRAISLADWHTVTLLAPFADKDKADIVRTGQRLGVPFDRTWSCYEGSERHCGRCGTCVERREAFLLAGLHDPTAYQGDPTVTVGPANQFDLTLKSPPG